MEQNVITFALTAPAMSVSGRAVIADPFLNSQFDLTVNVDFAAIGQAIAGAINAGAQQVRVCGGGWISPQCTDGAGGGGVACEAGPPPPLWISQPTLMVNRGEQAVGGGGA